MRCYTWAVRLDTCGCGLASNALLSTPLHAVGINNAISLRLIISHRIGRTYPGPPPEVEGLYQN
jgi:hypothetical protein